VYIDLRDGVALAGVRAQLAHCRQGLLFSDLLLAAWEMMHGQPREAAEALDRAIAQAPQMPLPRMMRVMCLEQLHAPPAALASAYRDLLRVQPFHAHAALRLRELETAPSVPLGPQPAPVTLRTPVGPAAKRGKQTTGHDAPAPLWSFTVVAGL
jgi:hypothetical protein